MTDAVGKIFMVLGFVMFVAFLYTLPVMWLWNWLMPIIFNLPKINIGQAWGLSLLSSLLFGKSSVNNKKEEEKEKK